MRPALMLVLFLAACGGSYTTFGTSTTDDEPVERCSPTSLGETSDPACDNAIEGTGRR